LKSISIVTERQSDRIH